MKAVQLVRRALALPPGEALRKARRLARMRGSELRRRVLDALTGDPLLDERADSLARGEGALPGADAVLPLAWPAAPPMLAPELVERVLFAARRALEHRFDLLGAGAVRVDYELSAPGLEGHVYATPPGHGASLGQHVRMERLLPGIVAAVSDSAPYEPIDWHVDFRSGWRWDPRTWYRAVPYGHAPGADVKLPWELSRLQHVGALGLAWRLAPASPEGARAPAEFVAEVVDWLAANRTRRGVNWGCTMDVALRAVSWLAGLAFFDGAPALTPEFRRLVRRALRLHGLHIEANLEYDADRAGNHYLSDVLGLVALGAALPEVPESDRWLAFGLQEVVSESRRQILPDGTHLEGSTSYHAFVLEIFLAAAAIAARLPDSRRARLREAWPTGSGDAVRGEAPPLAPLARQALDLGSPAVLPPEVRERLLAAARVTAELVGADGLLPLVGDNDSGRVFKLVPDLVPEPGAWREEPRDWRQALAVAGALYGDAALAAAGEPYALNGLLLAPREAPRTSLPSESPIIGLDADADARVGAVRRLGGAGDPAGALALFPQGGLALGRAGGLRLLATFGNVQREATGNHHHNDLLAFELEWRGRRFVADGGTYVYTALPALRDAFRRTSAHSTIAVPGREQRRWPPASVSLFLVTGDAEVNTLAAEPGRLELECRYAGVRHRRQWRWTDARLVIADEVEVAPGGPAAAGRAATLVLNLAPGVQMEAAPAPAGDGIACILRADGARAQVRIAGVLGAEVQPGVYSVGYGRRLPNVALVAPLGGPRCETTIELEEVDVEVAR